MKHNLIFLLLIFLSQFLVAQSGAFKKNYKLSSGTILYFDEKGGTLEPSSMTEASRMVYDSSFNTFVFKKQVTKSDTSCLKQRRKASIVQDDNNPGKLHVNLYRIKNMGKFEDDNKNYYYKLDNRSYRTFYFTQWQVGTLTTPFKVRPAITLENNIKIEKNHTVDLNAGLFIGHMWGWTIFKNRGKEKPAPSEAKIGLLVSPLSFGVLKLNGSNTLSSNLVFDKEVTTAYRSHSAGLIFSYNRVNFIFAVGKDYAPERFSNDWDYQGEWWYGFGMGLNFGLSDPDKFY